MVGGSQAFGSLTDLAPSKLFKVVMFGVYRGRLVGKQEECDQNKTKQCSASEHITLLIFGGL
jgi:hypothetical protein